VAEASEKKCSLRVDGVSDWASCSMSRGHVNRRDIELLNPSRGGESEETMRAEELGDRQSLKGRMGRESWKRPDLSTRTLLSEGRLCLQSKELDYNEVNMRAKFRRA
jgi:hypothetical protein